MLGLQAAQRLADRHAADTKCGSQLALLELGAVAEASTHDLCLQLAVHAVRQSLTLNAVESAACLPGKCRRRTLLRLRWHSVHATAFCRLDAVAHCLAWRRYRRGRRSFPAPGGGGSGRPAPAAVRADG